MVLTVYKLDFSPPVRSVLMTIGALKLTDVEFVDIDVTSNGHLTEEFTKINPQHTIPTIKDGDFVIWDRYPNLSAWLQRCSKLDFYQKYNAPGLQMIVEMVKSKLA